MGYIPTYNFLRKQLRDYLTLNVFKIILSLMFFSLDMAFIIVPVQFMAGISEGLGPAMTDLKVDVVPQMHSVGHAMLCFS